MHAPLRASCLSLTAAMLASCASTAAPSPPPPARSALPSSLAAAPTPSASPSVSASASATASPPRAVPERAPSRPTATAAPASFTEDGKIDEWVDQTPIAEVGHATLRVGTSAAGLAIALASRDGEPIASTGAACTLSLTLRAHPPVLPPLGLDRLFIVASFGADADCDRADDRGGLSADACRAWRGKQTARRASILAESTRAISIPCHASASGASLEATIPLASLPPVTTPALGDLEIQVTSPAEIPFVSFDLAEPIAPKPGTLLARVVADPATNPSGTAYAWRPGEPDKVTYYFNPSAGELPKAQSPETWVVDLTRRTKVAEQNGVLIERLDRAEPPWAFADRSLIVISKGGAVTATTRLGREKFAVLKSADHMDLVFAFGGNATPTSLHEYSVGSAQALRVAPDGKLPTEAWWSVEEEPPISPPDRGNFDGASVSSDGTQISFGGNRPGHRGRFEYRYTYDPAQQTFVQQAGP
ncbi:MAG: hypothetical protein U0414_10095 [Polyangiaceae bacterium]